MNFKLIICILSILIISTLAAPTKQKRGNPGKRPHENRRRSPGGNDYYNGYGNNGYGSDPWYNYYYGNNGGYNGYGNNGGYNGYGSNGGYNGYGSNGGYNGYGNNGGYNGYGSWNQWGK